ncbi:recombinational DNA repair protein RecR [Legionella beliardensis]|uniref:Recombination protein RecR n=1 Tax=Legionella beliardensis TaxID=91822 RepID=A0A378HY71_9GAMM|nr:recombination mediator RecR [Legionella beliardensis]STX27839.1 recombinational DNA repair protein RecR [Legionella beliardensis]
MDALNQLITALRCLPGIGPRSAQRMAYHLLQRQRQRGLHLATCLQHAMEAIKHCQRCNNYTEHDLCALCQDTARDFSILCIVENPADVVAIEQSNAYRGSYFVLMGKISPLDGIGPDEIGLPRLQRLILAEGITEVILALSPSIEGQTTTHFIRELLSPHSIKISQLAHGIPSGGELEFLDGITISSALRNRAEINE